MVDKRKLDLQETPTTFELLEKKKNKTPKKEQIQSHSSCSQMIDTTTALAGPYLLWASGCIWDLPDIRGAAAR